MSELSRLVVAAGGTRFPKATRDRLLGGFRRSGALVLGLACVSLGRVGVAQCPSEWLPGGGVDTLFSQGPFGTNLATIQRLRVLPNGDVVATGQFGSVGGIGSPNVARWDGVSWSPLADGVTVWAGVGAVEVFAGGDLVMGGQTLLPNNNNQVARWNGSAWAPLGTAMGGIYPYISALCPLPNGDLIAGGTFTTAGGIPASNIARWNGSVWSPLGAGMGGMGGVGPSGVHALARLPSGDVVAGGSFSTAGGVSAVNIARWDGTTWSSLGAGVGSTSGTEVNSLVVLPNGDLIAAGTFSTAGGMPADNIAKWDGTNWSPLGLGTDNTIRALAVMPNGDLVAAGDFYNAGGATAVHLGRWDGSNWAPLGQVAINVNGSTEALAVLADGTLVVGGHDILFTANAIARWGCRAGVAEAFPLGYGCGGSASSFYENFTVPPAAFDLANSRIRMTLTGSGYSVDHVAGAPTFFSPTSPDLGLGDEDITQPITLPFSVPYQGGTTNQIMVASNGFVFLQTDWSPAYYYGDPSQLLQGSARMAPLWSDLDPAAGSGSGTVHVDIDIPNQVVYATWLNVQEWNSPNVSSTFQVAMFASGGIEFRYLNCAMAAAPVLTGWSPGNSALDPGSRDLTAVPHFNTSMLAHTLPLTQQSSRPGLGVSVTLTTTQIPAASLLGATVVGWAHYLPGIDLGPLGMPGCYQFAGADVCTFHLPSSGLFAHSFAIPNDAVFVGAHLYSQALALVPGANPLGALTSNGVDLGLGRL